MLFFKRKKKEAKSADSEESDEDSDDASDNDSDVDSDETGTEQSGSEGSSAGAVSLALLSADVERLKAKFGTFYELNKATGERLSRVGEQIGELRSMVLERDKSFQKLEANANRAIDLVETVQPEKLMVEVRKIDSKVETLKANLESNEFVLNTVMKEMKDMRNQMSAFKGMDQVIKLNEEAKGELLEMKRLKAIIERHADKVETIFSELQKSLAEAERLKGTTEGLDKTTRQLISDVDSLGIKMGDLSTKKDVEKLVSRFDDFEKHAGNVLSMVDKKFKKIEDDVESRINSKVREMDKLIGGFKSMVETTPELDKFFHLLEKTPDDGRQQSAPQKLEPDKN